MGCETAAGGTAACRDGPGLTPGGVGPACAPKRRGG